MKKVNRADILTALNTQLMTMEGSMPSMEGSGMLMISEEIQPVIDISRPSKVPYVDWAGAGLAATGTLIPGKQGKRFVIVFASLNARNGAADAGNVHYIGIKINGVDINLFTITLVPNVANAQNFWWSGELVVDVNTDINCTLGSSVFVEAHVIGFYING